MPDLDYLKNIQFNFDIKKDVPELFTRTILLQAETIGLRKFIADNFSAVLEKTEKQISEEIDALVESAEKELWAQLVAKRGE
ncbi:MAG: hypothetical protein M1391_15435 [Bacteroidetes bacterium]|nr:hypothetical protein [Bacteroidota bacterium]